MHLASSRKGLVCMYVFYSVFSNGDRKDEMMGRGEEEDKTLLFPSALPSCLPGGWRRSHTSPSLSLSLSLPLSLPPSLPSSLPLSLPKRTPRSKSQKDLSLKAISTNKIYLLGSVNDGRPFGLRWQLCR